MGILQAPGPDTWSRPSGGKMKPFETMGNFYKHIVKPKEMKLVVFPLWKEYYMFMKEKLSIN